MPGRWDCFDTICKLLTWLKEDCKEYFEKRERNFVYCKACDSHLLVFKPGDFRNHIDTEKHTQNVFQFYQAKTSCNSTWHMDLAKTSGNTISLNEKNSASNASFDEVLNRCLEKDLKDCFEMRDYNLVYCKACNTNLLVMKLQHLNQHLETKKHRIMLIWLNKICHSPS